MADDQTNFDKVYSKIDDSNKQLQETIVREVARLLEYVRERDDHITLEMREKYGTLKAELSSMKGTITHLDNKTQVHSVELAKVKQTAHSTAKDVSAKTASVRSGVVSLVIGIIMLGLSLYLKA